MDLEVWAHCPPCNEWFLVLDPTVDAYFLCPVCLTAADRWERRPADWEDSGGGVA